MPYLHLLELSGVAYLALHMQGYTKRESERKIKEGVSVRSSGEFKVSIRPCSGICVSKGRIYKKSQEEEIVFKRGGGGQDILQIPRQQTTALGTHMCL